LRRAEEAMERGPGAASVYQPANPDARPASGTPPDRIVAALNERRLVAGYRPVLDARSRRPVFATLVPHLLGPDGAVPVGDLHEAAGGSLAPLVDLRLVELAATRLAHNPADRVALCVSSESLESREWLEGLAAHLGARPGIESRLVVTVDEASLLEPATRGRLDAVKALGVGLMLAGFGTGHASIRHLRSHPIDILRIGAALIHGLTRSPEARGVVRGLVDLAQHCGVATLAEGVEDETGARLLAEWGVDYIEGPLTGAAGVDLGQARPSRRSHAA
jgi:EAL domain-containing protein (putative c-di-GMP-specific phosphodiesterase class I)